jgi:hypothetical protein
MKIIQTFLFQPDFYEQIRHKLRIFQKEIKSTLNQELMHVLGERGELVRVIII